MSMISSLIDELNKSADEWNGSNMFELARMCREAADIIWQLRDDLQRTNAENAKLRELVRDYERCTMHADCGLCEYDGKLSTHCPFSPCFPDADELRELRVEVDA
jgi:hypothetical protein